MRSKRFCEAVRGVLRGKQGYLTYCPFHEVLLTSQIAGLQFSGVDVH